MRFTTAWADIAKQNVTLKAAISCLTLYSLVLTFTAMKLALKEPLVIERSDITSIANVGSNERTETEIKAFLKDAIEQRFNSNETATSYLSKEEKTFRDKEQAGFSDKGISQKILINSVAIAAEKITVETDRLISVGQIRSAFNFPLVVQIEKTSRTKENPYGLILGRVKEPEKDESKK